MTGGQTALLLDADRAPSETGKTKEVALNTDQLVVVQANESELSAHEMWLSKLEQQGVCVWHKDHAVSEH